MLYINNVIKIWNTTVICISSQKLLPYWMDVNIYLLTIRAEQIKNFKGHWAIPQN